MLNLFYLLFLALQAIATNNIPASEYAALNDFYVSTQGSQWTWLPLSAGQIWNFSKSASDTFPCVERWQGLTCSSLCGDDSGPCNIIGINLTDYNLNGPIPATFGDLTKLEIVMLKENRLSGSLPASFFSFKNATLISVANNALSGQIVYREMVKLSSLQSLNLNSNQFTGPLPLGGTSVYAKPMPQLINMDLGNNLFSGQIPRNVGNFTSLRVLALESNRLTGPLPTSIGLLTNLKELDLDSNALTGSLPPTMSGMSALEILFLQQNNFGPDMEPAVEGMTSLSTINAANNNFRGALPSGLFNLPNIETIILTQNCFDGSIPDSVCNAEGLVNLDLDGLTAGNGCLKRVAYAYVSHYISGSIPNCLYTLPKLKLLHLAGNGIHSTLPDIMPSSSLANVVMSYNRIGGSIPGSFQSYPFTSFDVSYNKISGTCQSMSMNLLGLNVSGGSFSTALSLEVNRLSGQIAPDFLNTPTINVVSGNLFACNKQSELPVNDPGSSTAVCGTQVTNLSFYGVAIAFGVALSLLLWYTCKGFDPYSKAYDMPSSPSRAAALSIALRRSVAASRGSETTDFMAQNPEEDNWKNQKARSRAGSTVELGTRGHSASSEDEHIAQPFEHIEILQTKLQKILGVDNATRAARQSRVDIFETSDLYTTKFFRGEHAKHQNLFQHFWHTYVSRSASERTPFLRALQAHLLTKSLFQWLKITNFVMHTKPEELIETTRFLKLLVEIRNTFWVITFFICFVSLPVFLGFREPQYVTHTYQYAYVPSIAYFAGFSPAIAFLMLIVACTVLILYAMTKIQVVDGPTSESRKVERSELKSLRNSLHTRAAQLQSESMGGSFSTTHSPHLGLPGTPRESEIAESAVGRTYSMDSVDDVTAKERDTILPYAPNEEAEEEERGCHFNDQGKFKLFVTIPLINFFVIVLVNVFYLYVIFTQGRSLKLFMTTVISVFKMAWNMLVLPGLMQSVKGSGPMFIRKLVVQMCLMIFNIVLAPCLINAIVSPDCMLRLFFPPAALVASAPITICAEYNSAGECIMRAQETITTSFEPPFIYSYQCASSTLVDYSPAYIQMYGIVACIMPAVAVFMFTLLEMNTDVPRSSLGVCGRFWVWLAVFLKELKTIPPIYKIARLLGNYDTVSTKDESDPHTTKSPMHKDSECVVPISEVTSKSALNTVVSDEEFVPFSKTKRRAILLEYHNTSTRKLIEGAPTQTILNPDTIFSHLMGHIMVLVSFGFAYPPLAVLITLTVSVVTLQWQVRYRNCFVLIFVTI